MKTVFPIPPLSRPSRTGLWAAVFLGLALPAQAELPPMPYDCLVEPAMEAALGAATTGVIAEVLVTRGMRVKAGDVLMRLDDRVQVMNLAVAREQANAREGLEMRITRRDHLAATLERAQRLASTGAGLATQVQEAEANLRIAEQEVAVEEYSLRLAAMEVERQEALLAQLTITSPFDGYVAEVLLNPGEMVRADTPLLRLVQLDPLHVQSWLPTSARGEISAGTTAEVSLTYPQTQVTASLSVIDEVFDAASNTFSVLLEIPNPDGHLPAGQRCTLVFASNDAVAASQ